MKGTTSLILGAFLVAGFSLALACSGTLGLQIELTPKTTLTATPSTPTAAPTATPTATPAAQPRPGFHPSQLPAAQSTTGRRSTRRLSTVVGHVPARLSRSITIAEFYSAPEGPARTHPVSRRTAEGQ
jgi:hypothetical protein